MDPLKPTEREILRGGPLKLMKPLQLRLRKQGGGNKKKWTKPFASRIHKGFSLAPTPSSTSQVREPIPQTKRNSSSSRVGYPLRLWSIHRTRQETNKSAKVNSNHQTASRINLGTRHTHTHRRSVTGEKKRELRQRNTQSKQTSTPRQTSAAPAPASADEARRAERGGRGAGGRGNLQVNWSSRGWISTRSWPIAAGRRGLAREQTHGLHNTQALPTTSNPLAASEAEDEPAGGALWISSLSRSRRLGVARERDRPSPNSGSSSRERRRSEERTGGRESGGGMAVAVVPRADFDEWGTAGRGFGERE